MEYINSKSRRVALFAALWAIAITTAIALGAPPQLSPNTDGHDDTIRKEAMLAVRKHKQAMDCLVLAIDSRNDKTRSYVILPRPQLDPRVNRPKFTYSMERQAGLLRFDIRWPDGLNGDRTRIKQELGDTKVIDCFRHHIRNAYIVLTLGGVSSFQELTDNLENEQIMMPSSRDTGLDPRLLADADAARELELTFRFTLIVSDREIPYEYSMRPFLDHPLWVLRLP